MQGKTFRSRGRLRGIAFSACTGLLLAMANSTSFASADGVEIQDPAKTVAELPIRMTADNEVLAPIYINNKGPLNFLVDTGATTTGIWNSAVQQNALNYKYIESARVAAADGVVMLRLLEFDAFRASVFALTPPLLMEFPDYYSYYRRPITGILGADYLKNHVVVFDFPRDMMVLYPKKTNLTRTMPGYFDAIPLRFRRGQDALFIKAAINGGKLTALVDTGASITTLLTSDYKRLGISLEGAKQITLTGINGNPVRGYLVTIPSLKAGTKVWINPTIVIAQFTTQRSDGFSMLLGMDLMGQTPFAIDYGRKRLLLAKPEKIKMVARRDPASQALVSVPAKLECSFPAAAREGLPCVAAEPRPE